MKSLASHFGQNLAVVGLAIALLVILVGGIWLTAVDKDLPDLLQIIGGAAVGALSSLVTREETAT